MKNQMWRFKILQSLEDKILFFLSLVQTLRLFRVRITSFLLSLHSTIFKELQQRSAQYLKSTAHTSVFLLW